MLERYHQNNQIGLGATGMNGLNGQRTSQPAFTGTLPAGEDVKSILYPLDSWLRTKQSWYPEGNQPDCRA